MQCHWKLAISLKLVSLLFSFTAEEGLRFAIPRELILSIVFEVKAKVGLRRGPPVKMEQTV